jgi:VWFA-related protein
MKVIIAKIRIFLIIFLLLFSTSTFSFAQPVLKEQSRIRDFGNSLENGEKDKKKNDSNDEDTIKVETNLVINDVLVINQKGNVIVGLKKEDFLIKENGEPQNIEVFTYGESADIPRSIVLVIDYSGSLTPYLNNSIEAAKLLVGKLKPQDRMAIVTDDIKLLTDFTKDKNLIRKHLESLKVKAKNSEAQGGWLRGHSLQYSALLAVIQELFDDEDIRPIVIFQTDGDESRFFRPMAYLSETEKENYAKMCKRSLWVCERKYSFEDFLTSVEKSRATIYSVIPGFRFLGVTDEERLQRGEQAFLLSYKESSNYNKNNAQKLSKTIAPIIAAKSFKQQEELYRISQISGGYTDYIEKPEDAETVYNTIFQTIENRYVIGYYPKNEAKDGKRRNVKIEVKGHPEYIVVGRKSYIAPSEKK